MKPTDSGNLGDNSVSSTPSQKVVDRLSHDASDAKKSEAMAEAPKVSEPYQGYSASTYRIFNPSTGQLVRTFETLGDQEADDLLSRAHDAYREWHSTPVAHRVQLFLTLARLLEANTERLAHQITLEMGKPFQQSVFEAGMPIKMLRYYAEHAEELLGDREVAVDGFSRVYTRRESMGVVLGIEPWNAPLYQTMRAAAPNLMLGNTVVLKPAEITVGCTLMLEEFFLEAGFPAGCFQTALVSHDQVSRYIADSRVRAVTITGSDRAGSAIGEQAGRHVKPVVLELGGSDAFIVLDSADVVAAAEVASTCRLAMGGQLCVSPKRVIVTDKVADAFIAQYAEAFANQKIGDPFAPDTTVGPISSLAGAELLQKQYDDAIEKGATVIVEGGRLERDGAFFKPAVLTGITPEMRLYYEEAFGPIGIIHRVTDADAAIAMANDSKYGLGGTVFATDPDEARRAAEAIDSGMVGINGFLGAPIEIPFGGTKASGVGRELGSSGMDAFANTKTYAVAANTKSYAVA